MNGAIRPNPFDDGKTECRLATGLAFTLTSTALLLTAIACQHLRAPSHKPVSEAPVDARRIDPYSQATTSAIEDGRRPAYEVDVAAERLPSPEDLSFAELKEILRTRRFSRIADLLAYLAKEKPNYMAHYTLAFNSRSLHESSKEHPRAIVFGTRANFIISFNGRPDQRAYEMLETVEFNHQRNTFEFREIEFNEKNQLDRAYTISEIGGPRIPGTHTPKCLTCHSGNRPIWESYNIWPGFYGGDDDAPIGTSAHHVGGISSLGVPLPATVVDEWRRWKDEDSRKGRYQHLPAMAISRRVPHRGSRPNTDLTVQLHRLNSLRIAQLLKPAIDAQSWKKYALLYALECQRYLVLSQARLRQANPAAAASTRERPNERMTELYRAWSRPARERIQEHIVFRHDSLRQDFGLSFAEYKRQLADAHMAQGQALPPYFSETDISSFLTQHIAQITRAGLPRDPSEPRSVLEYFIPLAKALAPSVAIDLWPSNLYEGVHDYNTGFGSETRVLLASLELILFSDHERATLARTRPEPETTDFNPVRYRSEQLRYCESLLARFPEKLE